MPEGQMFQRWPDAHLKIWIGIGLVALVITLGTPFLVAQRWQDEAYRFEACQENLRLDCDPSLVWVVAGWATIDGTDLISTVTAPTAAEQEGAGLILSIKPQNMAFKDGWYVGRAGETVTFTVKTAKAAEVVLTLVTKSEAGEDRLKIAEMRHLSDTELETTYRLPRALLADLEAKATASDGTEQSLSIRIASE
jgi:hypothetical protein